MKYIPIYYMLILNIILPEVLFGNINNISKNTLTKQNEKKSITTLREDIEEQIIETITNNKKIIKINKENLKKEPLSNLIINLILKQKYQLKNGIEYITIKQYIEKLFKYKKINLIFLKERLNKILDIKAKIIEKKDNIYYEKIIVEYKLFDIYKIIEELLEEKIRNNKKIYIFNTNNKVNLKKKQKLKIIYKIYITKKDFFIKIIKKKLIQN